MSMGQPKQTTPSAAEAKVVDITIDDLMALRACIQAGELTPEHLQLIDAFIGSYCVLLELLRHKKISIDRLRKILFGPSSEKTKDVVGPQETNTGPEPSPDENRSQTPPADSAAIKDRPKPKRKGHGRIKANNYWGAKEVSIVHETLQAGDPCPTCGEGTVYDIGPRVLIRIVGQAPLQATRYELQRLRCNLCGALFTAQLPAGVSATEKYAATAGTIIALLKYGSGLPFNRLQRLQGSLGVPLPAATQWEVVNAKAELIAPVYQELIREAAQGEVVHNDDTTNRILEFMGKRAQKAAFQEDRIQEQECRQPADEEADKCIDTGTNKKESQRTGLFTTGIVSQCGDRRIALFFTGRQHGGENLADVLRRRAEGLEPPIQMCDALSRNVPKELETILANCLAHGRRNFVEVYTYFPEECRNVLESLQVIYANDAMARRHHLSPETRLLFHQAYSAPTMDALKQWLARQFDEHLVEPNSSLGKAISYMLKHWEKLTLFLHKAGAPLDNNVCERALKKVILHRKNSYFFKTQKGAHVGDLYTSLIYTCELNGTNAFDYLTELELHADDVARRPERWMPWSYRTTLGQLSDTSTSSPDSVGSPRPCLADDVVEAL
jgi:transposase